MNESSLAFIIYKMKKPIAAFITDTHLFEKRSREDSLIDDNIDLNKSLYRQARKIVSDLGLKTLYHGGDIFHSRKSQTERLLNVWQDILNEFKSDDIVLVSIDGNHDKTDQANKKSFLRPYENHSHFKLVSTAQRFNLTSKIDLHLISYFPDEEYETLFKNWLKNKDDFASKNVLLTHKTFKGSLLNAGKISDNGLNESDFSNFDLVLVGHLHNKHTIGRVEYIGASHQHNFGEDERKGVTVLYDDLSIEQIQLDFPKYIKYEVNPAEITPKDLSDLKAEKETTGNMIKVVLKGTDSEVKAFDKKLLKEIGIKVESDIQVVQKEIIDEEVKPFTDSTIDEQFKEFCKTNKLEYSAGVEYLGKIFKIQNV